MYVVKEPNFASYRGYLSNFLNELNTLITFYKITASGEILKKII